jgi:hypothetical protein
MKPSDKQSLVSSYALTHLVNPLPSFCRLPLVRVPHFACPACVPCSTTSTTPPQRWLLLLLPAPSTSPIAVPTPAWLWIRCRGFRPPSVPELVPSPVAQPLPPLLLPVIGLCRSAATAPAAGLLLIAVPPLVLLVHSVCVCLLVCECECVSVCVCV